MDIDKTLRDIALFTARLTLGGSMVAHGAQKMFGIQEGPGLKGTAKMMDSLGFSPGERYAPALAAAEMGSGALIATGALGPVGPALLLTVMLVAIETVHRPKGYFAQKGGYEMNAMFIMIALLLANEGYGSLSLDEVMGLRAKLRPVHGWIALVGGIAGAMLMLGQRGEPPSQAAQRPQTETAATDSKIGATV